MSASDQLQLYSSNNAAAQVTSAAVNSVSSSAPNFRMTSNRIPLVMLDASFGPDGAQFPDPESAGTILMANSTIASGLAATVAGAAYQFVQMQNEPNGLTFVYARDPATGLNNLLRALKPSLNLSNSFNLSRCLSCGMDAAATPTSAGGSQGQASGFCLSALPFTDTNNLTTVNPSFLAAAARNTQFSVPNVVATTGVGVNTQGSCVPRLREAYSSSTANADLAVFRTWKTIPGSPNTASDGFAASTGVPSAAIFIAHKITNATGKPMYPNEIGACRVTYRCGYQSAAATGTYAVFRGYRRKADPVTNVAVVVTRDQQVLISGSSYSGFTLSFEDIPDDPTDLASVYFGTFFDAELRFTCIGGAVLNGRLENTDSECVVRSIYWGSNDQLRSVNIVNMSGLSLAQNIILTCYSILQGVVDPELAPFTALSVSPASSDEMNALIYAVQHRADVYGLPCAQTLPDRVASRRIASSMTLHDAHEAHAASLSDLIRYIPGGIRLAGDLLGHPKAGNFVADLAQGALDSRGAHAATVGSARYAADLPIASSRQPRRNRPGMMADGDDLSVPVAFARLVSGSGFGSYEQCDDPVALVDTVSQYTLKPASMFANELSQHVHSLLPDLGFTISTVSSQGPDCSWETICSVLFHKDMRFVISAKGGPLPHKNASRALAYTGVLALLLSHNPVRGVELRQWLFVRALLIDNFIQTISKVQTFLGGQDVLNVAVPKPRLAIPSYADVFLPESEPFLPLDSEIHYPPLAFEVPIHREPAYAAAVAFCCGVSQFFDVDVAQPVCSFCGKRLDGSSLAVIDPEISASVDLSSEMVFVQTYVPQTPSPPSTAPLQAVDPTGLTSTQILCNLVLSGSYRFSYSAVTSVMVARGFHLDSDRTWRANSAEAREADRRKAFAASLDGAHFERGFEVSEVIPHVPFVRATTDRVDLKPPFDFQTVLGRAIETQSLANLYHPRYGHAAVPLALREDPPSEAFFVITPSQLSPSELELHGLVDAKGAFAYSDEVYLSRDNSITVHWCQSNQGYEHARDLSKNFTGCLWDDFFAQLEMALEQIPFCRSLEFCIQIFCNQWVVGASGGEALLYAILGCCLQDQTCSGGFVVADDGTIRRRLISGLAAKISLGGHVIANSASFTVDEWASCPIGPPNWWLLSREELSALPPSVLPVSSLSTVPSFCLRQQAAKPNLGRERRRLRGAPALAAVADLQAQDYLRNEAVAQPSRRQMVVAKHITSAALPDISPVALLPPLYNLHNVGDVHSLSDAFPADHTIVFNLMSPLNGVGPITIGAVFCKAKDVPTKGGMPKNDAPLYSEVMCDGGLLGTYQASRGYNPADFAIPAFVKRPRASRSLKSQVAQLTGEAMSSSQSKPLQADAPSFVLATPSVAKVVPLALPERSKSQRKRAAKKEKAEVAEALAVLPPPVPITDALKNRK
jgi:hypothetical protein